MQTGAFTDSRLKLVVAPAAVGEEEEGEEEEGEEKDFSDSLPDPPFTVRDKAHLEELLLEGINSPKSRVTEQSWEHKRQEVRRRHAAREQSRQL